MPAWSAIECYEEHNASSENHGIEASGGDVTLRVAWANRYLLVADIIGRVHAWIPGLRASQARLRHDGATASVNGQAFESETVLVDVTYDSRVTEDLISEELIPTVEFITLDWRKFRWGAANGKRIHEDEAPGRQFRTLRLAREEMLVTAIHQDELDLVGTANDAAIVSPILGKTFAAGTLLFEGSRITRTVDSAGNERYGLSKSWIYNKETWNKFWRAETQTYESLFIAGGGAYENFPLEDHSNIYA